MSVLGKRSPTSPEPEARPPTQSNLATDGKKSLKTTSDIDELGLIPPEEAFTIDTSSLFPEVENRGIRVICVVESLRLHYDLLLSLLPTYIGSCALVRDTANNILGTGEHSIPLKAGLGFNFNHFLKLGVLHPMGGAQSAMDSIIVIDAHDRRRLVVPFGWGAGRHVLDEAGGKMIQERLIEVFIQSVGQLLEGK